MLASHSVFGSLRSQAGRVGVAVGVGVTVGGVVGVGCCCSVVGVDVAGGSGVAVGGTGVAVGGSGVAVGCAGSSGFTRVAGGSVGLGAGVFVGPGLDTTGGSSEDTGSVGWGTTGAAFVTCGAKGLGSPFAPLSRSGDGATTVCWEDAGLISPAPGSAAIPETCSSATIVMPNATISRMERDLAVIGFILAQRSRFRIQSSALRNGAIGGQEGEATTSILCHRRHGCITLLRH